MKRTSSILFVLVLVLSLVLIIAGPMATPVQATSTGPNSGSTAADDGSIGTVTWSSVNSALTQDDSYASAILTETNHTSHYLEVTDFGFGISSGATIEGIMVEVDRHESSTPLRVFDNSIRLVKGGAINGTDKSTGLSWPSSDTNAYVSYGNSTDLWGLNWTPADINGSDFGVAISASKDDAPSPAGDRVAYVDHIRITVYYSIPGYYLTMAANPPAGGTAIDETGMSPYEEDEEVNIKAEAATGYEFVSWTATPLSDGFGDANAEETTFTMPAYNVTVTANFQVETGPQEPPTVTTLAASGIGDDSVTLNMDYTLGDYSPVYLRFAYRKHGTTDWNFTPEVNRAVGDTYTRRQTGLTPGTEYDFRAELKYNNHRIEGYTRQFTTDTSPSVGCFIATAAYGTPSAEQIDVLREFRDVVLLKSTVGSELVSLYYRLSPPIADFIAGHEVLRTMVRELLIDPIVWVVQATGGMWRQ